MQYTLEPLVYLGPAEGKPEDLWRLKLAAELLALKVCDMACGSGAFLVQVCISLAERLLEAWEEAEKRVEGSPRITPYGEVSKGLPDEQLIPLDRQERLIYARRLVAERCIYGVDKNPLAVEMAKLSLWLLTLAKDKPFTFLDHAIRCGDSLVGLSSLDQLLRFSMTENAKVRPLMEQQRQQIEKRLEATMLLRKQIEMLPSNTPQDIEQGEDVRERRRSDKAACLRRRHALGSNVGGEERRRVGVALNGMLAEVEYKFKDLPAEQLEDEAGKRLRKAGIAGRFHWPLEFPEVFVERGGFDAFVSNPPFMGGSKITGVLTDKYREHLVHLVAGGLRGRADLCAYFLLRSKQLVQVTGCIGMLATNTIAQGDTREVGLDQLVSSQTQILRAIPSLRWPGTANLYVAIVWLWKGKWSGPCYLESKPVSGITPFFTVPGLAVGLPHRLRSNENLSFKGVFLLGTGFLMKPEESQILISKDINNKSVLYPFLNGEDLNSRPDQSASRWVINFFDWPLSRESSLKAYSGPVAEDYPDCLAIVKERVKPERDILGLKTDASAQGYAKWWWQYGRRGGELYERIQGFTRVLVIARVSRTTAFAFVRGDQILSEKLIVFTLDKWWLFSLLQSSLHYEWCWAYASTLKTDLNYSQTDCFENYPLPANPDSLDSIGKAYHEHRSQIMLSRNEGLTKTYSRFNKPDEVSDDIKALRDLHVEMDKAVAAAYGWSDLDLGHGFHETKQGTRFTISETARREVLARLLKLNHERHAEEVAQGLHDKEKGKGTKAPRKAKGRASSEPSLFGEEDRES